jgi:hypothetical protein
MAVEAPRRSKSLKKLAMPAREAHWWCRSLLSSTVWNKKPPLRLAIPAWQLSWVTQVAAIAQQKETPGRVAVCDHKSWVVHRLWRTVARSHSRTAD